jgi:hypothetical protein
VRKRLESFSFIATVAALFAMISFGSLLQAQQTTPDTQPSTPQTQPAPQTQQPPDTQAPPPGSTPESRQQTPSQTQPAAPPPDATGSKELVGTIMKQGDKYVFQDTATGATYDIDHQDEVKKFEGKRVRVHGTIDPSTKMIHVQ